MIESNSADGHLAGLQLQPRMIAALAYTAGWHDLPNLTMAVAICLAESQGYEGAYNDNLDNAGVKLSRDVGLWEINIPATQIGTEAEFRLYTPNVNAAAAHALWARTGGWGRWASYSSGVVFHDYYTARACLGVFNYAATFLNTVGGKLPVPIFTLAELHAKVEW